MEQEILAAIERANTAFGERHGEIKSDLSDINARLTDLEKKRARVGDHPTGNASWGQTVSGNSEFKQWVAGNCSGSARISVKAALTTDGGSAGSLIVPDRDANGVMLPRRRMTVRSLLGQGRTGTSSIEYFRETVFTNNAGMVSEGGLKPESAIEYDLQTSPVRTIAHWIPASRQVMEDAPQLETLVDSSLRYGLAYKEEMQMLAGDGTGENLLGMIPQATDFDDALMEEADPQEFDVIKAAIAQAELADLPATGIILSTRDWFRMIGLKDSNGRYLGAGPFGAITGMLWQLPVVWTNAMAPGDFLTGAFASAVQLYDRMDPEVQVSDSDRDNFIRNMLTIRGEQRLAMAVKRPQALIYGSFSSALSGS